MNKNKQIIIEQALFHLQNELGSRISWRKNNEKENDYDAVFRIDGKSVFVELKNEVRPNQINHFRHLTAKYDDIIIVANYITSNAKKLLRDHKVNYVDRVGNTWLQLGPIHIHIEGLPNRPLTEERKNRAFTRTGIKVVFQFLQRPELLNATYREIVDITGVSLGTVPKVMEGLKLEGFILKRNEKEWIIKDYHKLLDRWQNEFVTKLKPDLLIQKYQSIDPHFHSQWSKMELIGGTLWGGEPAGDLLTKYLKPEVYTVYTSQTPQEIMKDYRWVPHPEGKIHVYKKFWKEKNHKAQNYVPAVLAYADLMGAGDSRSIEIATMIYEKFLQKH